MFSLRSIFGLDAKRNLGTPPSLSFKEKAFMVFGDTPDTEFFFGDIKNGEKIKSSKNVVIIGNVGIDAQIESGGSIIVAKVEENYLVLHGVGINSILKAAKDIFIHQTGPSASLEAGGNIYAASKIIAELTDQQVDDIDYFDDEKEATESFRARSRINKNFLPNYKRAGGPGPRNTIKAGGDFYADNIGPNCVINVKGSVSTLHYGAYGYYGDEYPDWWPNAEAEWRARKNGRNNTTLLPIAFSPKAAP